MAKNDQQESKPNRRQEYSKLKSFTYGSLSGIFAKGLTIPFDRLKILIQNQVPPYRDVGIFRRNGNGVLTAFRNMYQELGPSGLYRSQSIALFRHGTHGGLGFLIRDYLHENYNKGQQKTKWKPFVFGAAAGCGATFITTPLDTVRVLHTINANSSFKEIWREKGRPPPNSSTTSSAISFLNRSPSANRVRNLYAGHVAAQSGVFVYAGLNFGMKDTTMDLLYDSSWREMLFENSDYRLPFWYCSFISGFFGSMVTQFITYPLDVLKRRRQGSNKTYFELLKSVRQEPTNGKRFLNIYRGFSINIVRHPIANGLVWAMKEGVLDRYDPLSRWV